MAIIKKQVTSILFLNARRQNVRVALVIAALLFIALRNKVETTLSLWFLKRHVGLFCSQLYYTN